MSEKDVEVSEAQLPMPHVEHFMGALQEWQQKKQGANEPHFNSMFGDDSDHEEQLGKPKNSKRTHPREPPEAHLRM